MIFICYPIPAFPGDWGIRDSIIRQEVIPIIGEVAKESGAALIDLYKPLIGASKFFPDTVHPNGTGAGLIAKVVSRKLKLSKKKILCQKKITNNNLNQSL